MTVSYSGNFVRLLFRWKGSIWRSVWVELLVFLALFYAVRLFHNYAIPIIDPGEETDFKNKFNLLCKEFNEYTHLIPLTFLLGFYVTSIVSRWWSQFECLNWPEDLLSIICLIIHDNTEESRKRRHQIARYVNLAAAIAWRDVSDKIRLRFPTIRHLVDAGLLTECEFLRLEEMEVNTTVSVLWLRLVVLCVHIFIYLSLIRFSFSHKDQSSSPGVRWIAPLLWVQQLITAEVESGRASPNYVTVFANELKQYRTSFRKLFCHDWVCVPLVYTQVASLATYSFFVFCLFGRQHLDSENGFDTVFPLFTVVQFLFYVGWYKVGQDLMRPFGLDDDDIELSYILDRNLVISFAIVDLIQTDSAPAFEEDVYWCHSQNVGNFSKEVSSLKFGRIDLSRAAHKHPPKLHTCVQMHREEKKLLADHLSRGESQRYIAW